jgi:hypothetical protein
MPLSLHPCCRLPRVLMAGAAALTLTLAGVPGRAQAGESPQPTCWGPENSPADCPDYSLMDPYTYGKYYYRQPYTYGYDRRYYQDPYPYYGYGPSHGR